MTDTLKISRSLEQSQLLPAKARTLPAKKAAAKASRAQPSVLAMPEPLDPAAERHS